MVSNKESFSKSQIIFSQQWGELVPSISIDHCKYKYFLNSSGVQAAHEINRLTYLRMTQRFLTVVTNAAPSKPSVVLIGRRTCKYLKQEILVIVVLDVRLVQHAFPSNSVFICVNGTFRSHGAQRINFGRGHYRLWSHGSRFLNLFLDGFFDFFGLLGISGCLVIFRIGSSSSFLGRHSEQPKTNLYDVINRQGNPRRQN